MLRQVLIGLTILQIILINTPILIGMDLIFLILGIENTSFPFSILYQIYFFFPATISLFITLLFWAKKNKKRDQESTHRFTILSITTMMIISWYYLRNMELILLIAHLILGLYFLIRINYKTSLPFYSDRLMNSVVIVFLSYILSFYFCVIFLGLSEMEFSTDINLLENTKNFVGSILSALPRILRDYSFTFSIATVLTFIVPLFKRKNQLNTDIIDSDL